MRKNIFLSCILSLMMAILVAGCCHCKTAQHPADPGYVVHPEPTDPVYIPKTWYSELKATVPAPPKNPSVEQTADEQELLRRQSERSVQDCERANTEIKVTAENLFEEPRGPLTVAELKAAEPLAEVVRNEGNFFIQEMKRDYARPRPFLYVKDLTPCVPKEHSTAYPSGHAGLSKLYALFLEDVYPAKKEALEKKAETVAVDRVMGGVHHPTDIRTGREIAEVVYAKLKKNPKFVADLTALKKSVAH